MVKLNAAKCSAVRRGGWDGSVTLTPALRGEVKWWIRSIAHNSPRAWFTTTPNATMTTDASPSGWGATWEQHDREPAYAWGAWSPLQRRMTSNIKELTAILLGLREWIRLLPSGSALIVRSDNTAAVFTLQRWRGGQNRIATLRRIANLLSSRGISIRPVYLPGKQNETADELSRMGSAGEYSLTMASLRAVKDMVSSELTLDVFASAQTRQLPRYCSLKRDDPNTVAVDGFRADWRNEVVLLHPPPNLILPTIRKAMEEQARGVLVVPEWKGQPWFPLLETLSTRRLVLGPYQTAVTRTPLMTSRGWLLPPGNVVACTMDGRTTTERCSSTN
jgi:ribonuclease HI